MMIEGGSKSQTTRKYLSYVLDQTLTVLRAPVMHCVTEEEQKYVPEYWKLTPLLRAPESYLDEESAGRNGCINGIDSVLS